MTKAANETNALSLYFLFKCVYVVNGRTQITTPSLDNTICWLPVVLSMSNTSVNINNEAHDMASSYSCLQPAVVGKGYF